VTRDGARRGILPAALGLRAFRVRGTRWKHAPEGTNDWTDESEATGRARRGRGRAGAGARHRRDRGKLDAAGPPDATSGRGRLAVADADPDARPDANPDADADPHPDA
jgi:hypothetical protein